METKADTPQARQQLSPENSKEAKSQEVHSLFQDKIFMKLK